VDGYVIAWIVVVAAAAVGAVASFRLLGGVRSPLVKWLTLVLLLVAFLVPSPVPGYPGVLAPAFVVAVFEAFLQIDGKPGASLRILGGALLAAALVTGLAYYLLAMRRKRDHRAENAPTPD